MNSIGPSRLRKQGLVRMAWRGSLGDVSRRPGGRWLRGPDARTGSLFGYVDLEARVPEDHPLRLLRRLVDAAPVDLSPAFERLYAPPGRPSIPPERLVRALPLQAFYSVRSGRQLMERLGYDLLFRRFVGLGIDAPAWDVTVFTKDRERLLEGDIARELLAALLNRPEVEAPLSDEHFPVDGTPIQAWASLKGFRPGDGSGKPPAAGRNGERDFHGGKRSNAAHASTTDPDARLFRKGRGKEAGPCLMGHALMENRHGLIVDGRVSERSHRHGRAGRGGADGRGGPGPAPDHGGRRQALRHAGLRRPTAGAGRHAARGAEHDQPPLGDRRPHDAAPRPRAEPTGAQTDRGGVRLDRGGGAAAPRPAPRQGAGRLAVHARCGGGLQPDPAGQAARSRGMTAAGAPTTAGHTAARPTLAAATARTGGPTRPVARRSAPCSAAC